MQERWEEQTEQWKGQTEQWKGQTEQWKEQTEQWKGFYFLLMANQWIYNLRIIAMSFVENL
jgi:hypothetical protein